MTVDWTKFRDGDRVRVTFEGVWRTRDDDIAYLAAGGHNYHVRDHLYPAASAELITPEIVTGAAYVDADGKAYLGGSQAGTLIGVGYNAGKLLTFGRNGSLPLPAGLRRAKVVPE
jgi:hypothetical protein